jgi:hypothetical protein
MAVKAPLKLVLRAGDTIVAESDDAGLWQRVLAAMIEASGIPAAELRPVEDVTPAPEDAATDPSAAQTVRGEDAVDRFADELGVSKEAILRACAPSAEPPYLHLDRNAWEEMKRGTPPRGPGSIAPAALAATLLVLWFRCADLGSPTMKMVYQVLRRIGVRDKNGARVVQEREWLQTRGGTVVLKAASASRAVALAKAFCARDWSSHRSR